MESKNQTGRMELSSYQQDDGTVYNLVLPMDDFLETVEEMPITWIDPKLLLATQIWIDPIQGGGDAVVPGLNEYPLVVKTKDGKMHVLDGHHRVDDAIKYNKDRIKVYLIPVNR